MKTNRFFYN